MREKTWTSQEAIRSPYDTVFLFIMQVVSHFQTFALLLPFYLMSLWLQKLKIYCTTEDNQHGETKTLTPACICYIGLPTDHVNILTYFYVFYIDLMISLQQEIGSGVVH